LLFARLLSLVLPLLLQLLLLQLLHTTLLLQHLLLEGLQKEEEAIVRSVGESEEGCNEEVESRQEELTLKEGKGRREEGGIAGRGELSQLGGASREEKEGDTKISGSAS
jgi:hypothetical protein